MDGIVLGLIEAALSMEGERCHHSGGRNLPLIQFVTNLSQIGASRFTVVAVPLAIKGADASPVRVIALVE